MFHSRINRYVIVFLMATTGFVLSTSAQQKEKPKKKGELVGTPVLWREPSDIKIRNLLLGAGGASMKPNLAKVTFIAEKTGGYSKKYRVRDASGNEWIAKLGKEAQPDTSANRLLWAVGYETEVAYLIPSLKIERKGDFENVRLEARPKEIDRTGNWKWEQNPFLGKPEFQGLKIMMALINNWDLKDDNNEILAPRNAPPNRRELRYIISDLGGSFGKTGGFLSRSRNEPSDFVKADFIKKVNGDLIDFNYGGKNQKLLDNITVKDARWISARLGQLSEAQIKDAFRAANYSAEDVNQLAHAVQNRIAALASVSGQMAGR